MNSRNLNVILAAALVVGLTAATPGFAANDQDGSTTTRKATRHTRTAPPPRSPVRIDRPMNSCDYDRAAGNCVIDLGYGRCMDCSSGPFK
jgi:hypothetical protein